MNIDHAIDDAIDKLVRKLVDLEALHPLDAKWPTTFAEVRDMHRSIEGWINHEIGVAFREVEKVFAGLDPESRNKVMADLAKAYPDLSDLIHRTASRPHGS